MTEIKVYPQEIKDNIEELVRSNSSISYASPFVNKLKDEWVKDFIDKTYPELSAKANRNIDRADLYPLQTVLVTTGWNINTDVFTKEETWAARFSAQDKPFNYQHNENDIIGHMTGNFVIDDNFKIVSMESEIDNVPNKFHIVTPAVIYKFRSDNDKKQRIEKIISEIEAGNKWYVSMECLFSDFDYGIINAHGESRIIQRNQSTAGLTRFLKQYGGPGVVEGGYSIGRVLKNMLFCGKGLTDNPANPESVIFNKVQTFKSISADLGYINLCYPETNEDKGKIIMPEEIKSVVSELKTFNIEENSAFKIVKAEKDKLEGLLAEANKKLSETSVQNIEKEMASLKSKITTLETDLTSAVKSVAELTTENKSLSEKNTSLETEISAAKKNQLRIERTSALISSGASEEEAKAIVDKFENVSAEQFSAMVELVKSKWSDKEEKDEKEMAKDCKAENVLDSAKSEADAPLGVTKINELESISASIAEWYKNNVRTNKKKS